MRALQRLIRSPLLTNPIGKLFSAPQISASLFLSFRPFSLGNDKESSWISNVGDSSSTDVFNWDAQSSFWSAGLTREHFDGEIVGREIGPRPNLVSGSTRWTDEELNMVKRLREENLSGKALPDNSIRDREVSLKLLRKPRRHLKDSEKTEMYKKHKENPDAYSVEILAKEYMIPRQRVHAILWLKELEEEEEKKLVGPRDDSIEILLDTVPEFFNSRDREFEFASVPCKQGINVMPEGWDGATRDPGELCCETSTNEDEIVYQDFVQRFNCNKMKMAKKHKYNQRHSPCTQNDTDERLGPPRRHKNAVSISDGSRYPLDKLRKIFMKRRIPSRSKKILL